eukprot:7233998-Prymnesium_polylepis.1
MPGPLAASSPNSSASPQPPPPLPSMVVPRKTHLWMFWDKGEEDFRSHAERPGDKNSHSWRCFNYWRLLNPGFKVRLVDNGIATALSPAYRSLLKRDLPIQLLADVLRLDLLSLFGGVWADVTVCPVHPIGGRALGGGANFFAWHGPRDITWGAAHSRRAGTRTHAPVARGVCTAGWWPWGLRTGSWMIDNWFLASPYPHHVIVDSWLAAIMQAIDRLGDGSRPGKDYVYHLPHCVFTE